MSHSPKKRLGRPHIDPALATKHRLLAFEVKSAAQCSWDELDVQLLGMTDYETKRPRMMWSMARYGLHPATPQRHRDGFDLISRLEKDKRFSNALANYRSALWAILTPPAPSLDEQRLWLTQLIADRGLFRANEKQQYWGAWLFPEEKSFREHQDNAMVDLALQMNGDHLLDKIALFGCVYVDATDRLDLVEAKSCIDGMRFLIAYHCNKISGFNNDLIFDLCDLITARVLKNDWSNEPRDFRDHSIRLLARSSHLSIDNPRASPTGLGSLLPLTFWLYPSPIVFKNNRTRWVERYTECLSERFEIATPAHTVQVVRAESCSAEELNERHHLVETSLGVALPKAKDD